MSRRAISMALCALAALFGARAHAGESLKPGFLSVADYVAADGKADVADALQRLIDTHPNRTLYFADGTYLVSKPICTPADPKRSVDLRLSNYAVIKAAPGWTNVEAVVRLGGSCPKNDNRSLGSNYALTGGIIDGSGVAKGVSIDSGRETKIRDVAIKNVLVGLHVKHGANSGSSDSDISDVNIVGNNATNSVGVLVEGFDNTFSNMRIMAVYTGVRLIGGGNSLRNIHPLFTSGYDAYEQSKGFDDRAGDNWFDFCYSDQFSTGFNLGPRAAGIYHKCFAFWYAPNPKRRHTAIHAEDQFKVIFRDLKIGFNRKEAVNTVLEVGRHGGSGVIDNLRANAGLIRPDDAYVPYLRGRLN